MSFCTCLEKHTDRLQFDLYMASAGKHMNVHKSCTVLVYTHDGTAAQGGWGMQAAIEMQVIGLMLNRCDSLLERQTGSRKHNQTQSGSWIHPWRTFLASHGDNAKNTAFKCNKQTEQASTQKAPCASFIWNRMCARAEIYSSLSRLCIRAAYLHLSVDHRRGGRGSAHLTAPCFHLPSLPGVLDGI